MRNFKQVAIHVFSILIFAFPVISMAAQLPTDAERLVIETRNGPVAFSVELALTADDRASGLMNRQSMPADHGMLFRFDQTRQVLMWMKNTPQSLDILFIQSDGIIINLEKNTTPYSLKSISSKGRIKWVLELTAGFAEKKGISVGDKLIL